MLEGSFKVSFPFHPQDTNKTYRRCSSISLLNCVWRVTAGYWSCYVCAPHSLRKLHAIKFQSNFEAKSACRDPKKWILLCTAHVDFCTPHRVHWLPSLRYFFLFLTTGSLEKKHFLFSDTHTYTRSEVVCLKLIISWGIFMGFFYKTTS